MSHRHKKTFYPVGATKSKEWRAVHKPAEQKVSAQGERPKLEIVLKCDSAGSVEAVTASILQMTLHEAEISIIHSGIGDINKSDILLAETGSRLIAGFQVGVAPDIERELREHSVEARLYDVIYKLTDDMRNIAEGIAPLPAPEETIIGNARVIALFKSSRKGIIIGCEVLEGHLAVGQHFRIISAVGTVYSGSIESMHIEKNIVQKASAGQQAGIKIKDFNKVKIGDLVESYRASASRRSPPWQPDGGVVKKFS